MNDVIVIEVITIPEVTYIDVVNTVEYTLVEMYDGKPGADAENNNLAGVIAEDNAMGGDIDAENSFSVVNLRDAVEPGDAVPLHQVEELVDNITLESLRQENNQLNGPLDLQGNQLKKVAAGTETDDAVNVDQLNSKSSEAVTEALNYAADYTDTKTDAAVASANAYTDSQLVAVYRGVGDWDASVGTWPLLRASGAAIKRGDTFNVTVAGTISGRYFDIGDAFYANMDSPGQNSARWSRFEVGTDQGTETTRGTFKVISSADIQDENTTNSTDVVTGIKLWLGLARMKAIAQTISGLWTFNTSPKINTLSSGQYVKTDGNKQLVSASAIPQSDVTSLTSDLAAKEATVNKNASGGYAGLTLFKLNLRNALGTVTSFLTNSNTAARTYTFQDRDGTILDNTNLDQLEQILIYDNVNSATITGTGAQMAKSYRIPANTFALGDECSILIMFERVSANAATSALCGLRTNTVNTFSSATPFAQNSSTNSIITWPIERRLEFKTGNSFDVTNAANNYNTDISAVGSVVSNVTQFDRTVDNWFFVYLSLFNGADQFRVKSVYIGKKKQKLTI